MSQTQQTLITTYRYGTPRTRDELVRLGATRKAPPGSRADWQRLGYCDTWVPLLAPSVSLLAEQRKGTLTPAVFAKRYKAEMKQPASRQIIELLAAMLPFQPVSLGCSCEDEAKCHRLLLRDLILAEAKKRGARFAALQPSAEGQTHYVSPVCYAFLEEQEPKKT